MFKTLSARIRGAKTELQELGEEEDIYTQSTSTMRKKIQAITGFDIMKDDNTFKSIKDILVGVGQEFDDLTDIERSAVLETMGGKRASNALAAVLSNPQMIEDAYETALNAEGSAAKEHAHYAESVQYSIDRVKASLQELAVNFMSSDFLKGAIDAANAFIKALNGIVDAIGPVIPLLTTVGAINFGLGKLDPDKGSIMTKLVDFLKDIPNNKELQNVGQKITSALFKNIEMPNIIEDIYETSFMDSHLGETIVGGLAESTDDIVNTVAPALTQAFKEGADDLDNVILNSADDLTGAISKPLKEAFEIGAEGADDMFDAVTTAASSIDFGDVWSESMEAAGEVGGELFGNATAEAVEEILGGAAAEATGEAFGEAAGEIGGEVLGNTAGEVIGRSAAPAFASAGSRIAAFLAGGLSAFGWTVVGVGIAAAIGAGLYNLKKYFDEVRLSQMREGADQWENDKKSLDEYREKIRGLQEELNNTDLSHEEQLRIKQDLLEIQDQIIEKYGDEAKNIDLINGNLDQEIAKLDQIAIKKAKDNLIENSDLYDEAHQKMSSPVSLSDNFQFGVQDEEIANKVINTIKNLDIPGVSLSNPLFDQYNGVINVDFAMNTDDVYEATDVLDNFKNVLDEIISKAGGGDYQKSFIELRNRLFGTSGYDGIAGSYAYGRYSDYSSVDQSYAKMQFVAKGGESYINSIENAIKQYNEAVDSMDYEGFKQAEDHLQNMISLTKLFAEDNDVGDYLNTLLESSLSKLKEAEAQVFRIQELLTKNPDEIQKSIDETNKKIEETTTRLNNLGVNVTDFKIGNIDLSDSRREIQWTEESVRHFGDAIKSWDINPEDLKNGIKTALGEFDKFTVDGVDFDVAFTPQFYDGQTTRLLDSETVHNYIEALFDSITAEGKPITLETVLEADSKGLEEFQYNGKRVTNIIADISKSEDGLESQAQKTAKAMADGSVSMLRTYKQTASELANDASMARLVEKLKDLKITTLDVQDVLRRFRDGNIDPFNLNEKEKAIMSYANSFGLLGESVKDLTNEDIDKIAEDLQAAGIAIGETFKEVEETVVDVVQSFASQVQAAIEQIDAINTALTNNVSGKGLSYKFDIETGTYVGDIVALRSAFEGLTMATMQYNPSKLFYRSAMGIRLNTDELRKLEAQQISITRQKFEDRLTQLRAKLNTEIQRSTELTAKGDIENAKASANQISRLKEQIQNVKMLAATYEGSVNAYQRWLDAQSSGDPGDMFANVATTGLQRLDELMSQGKVGHTEVRALLELLTGTDLTNASIDMLIDQYNSLDHVLGQTSVSMRDILSGENGEGLQKFAEILKEIGYATGGEGQMQLTKVLDIEDVAKKAHMSEEMVEIFINAMKTYGAEITTVSSDVAKALNELDPQIDFMEARLNGIFDESGINRQLTIDVGDPFDLSALETKLATAKQLMADVEHGYLQLDNAGIKALEDYINLVEQKIEVLKDNDPMKVLSSSTIQYGEELQKQFDDLIVNFRKYTDALTDTDILNDENLLYLISQLETLPDEVKLKILTEIGVDVDPDATGEEIGQKIAAAIKDGTATTSSEYEAKHGGTKSAAEELTEATKTAEENITEASTTFSETVKGAFDYGKTVVDDIIKTVKELFTPITDPISKLFNGNKTDQTSTTSSEPDATIPTGQLGVQPQIGQRQADYKSYAESIQKQAEELESAAQDLEKAIAKVNEAGLDPSQTKVGNIDLSSGRQEIQWTSELLKNYGTQIQSWGGNAEDLLGKVSSAMVEVEKMPVNGMNFDVAFTPMLQGAGTGGGPAILSKDLMKSYLQAVIIEAMNSGEPFSFDAILKIDQQGVDGFEENGVRIKNMIGAIGESFDDSKSQVEMTAEAIYNLGENGEINKITQQINELGEPIDTQVKVSVEGQEYVKELQDYLSKIGESGRIHVNDPELLDIINKINSLPDDDVRIKILSELGIDAGAYNTAQDIAKALANSFTDSLSTGTQTVTEKTSSVITDAQKANQFLLDATENVGKELPKMTAAARTDVEVMSKSLTDASERISAATQATGFASNISREYANGDSSDASSTVTVHVDTSEYDEFIQRTGTEVKDSLSSAGAELIAAGTDFNEKVTSAASNVEQTNQSTINANEVSASTAEKISAQIQSNTEGMAAALNEASDKMSATAQAVASTIDTASQFSKAYQSSGDSDSSEQSPSSSATTVKVEVDTSEYDDFMQKLANDEGSNHNIDVKATLAVEGQELFDTASASKEYLATDTKGVSAQDVQNIPELQTQNTLKMENAKSTTGTSAQNVLNMDEMQNALNLKNSLAGTTTGYIYLNIDGAINALNSLQDRINSMQNQTIYVNGSANSSFATGTALSRFYGNAYAGGNWGTPKTEEALLAEVGPEILVNPSTGRWELVGQSGPVMKKVPKGSIIFNHKQTEDILKHGHTNSRGQVEGIAHLSGTAYGYGGWNWDSNKNRTNDSYFPDSGDNDVEVANEINNYDYSSPTYNDYSGGGSIGGDAGYGKQNYSSGGDIAEEIPYHEGGDEPDRVYTKMYRLPDGAKDEFLDPSEARLYTGYYEPLKNRDYVNNGPKPVSQDIAPDSYISDTTSSTKPITSEGPDEFIDDVTDTVTKTSEKVSKSAEKAFDQIVDWIEIYVDRLDNRLADLAKKADDAFLGYNDRIKASKKYVAVAESKIDDYKAAADAYLNMANNVDISHSEMRRIRNGDLDIEHVKDEEKYDKLMEYKDYYEKYLAALEKVEGLSTAKYEQMQKRFQLTNDMFASKDQEFQSKMEVVQATIESLRANGEDISEHFEDYQELQQLEKDTIRERARHIKALQKSYKEAIDNGLDETSEAAMQMRSTINSLEAENKKATANITSYWRAWMQQVKEQFDDIDEYYSLKSQIIDNRITAISTTKDISTETGYRESAVYQKQMMRYEELRKPILEAELERLEGMLSNVKKGTKDWYTMLNTIDGVKEEIRQSTLSLLQMQNAIDKIKFEQFDAYIDKIHTNLVDDPQFLIDYMSNFKLFEDSGQYNKMGQATEALHVEKFSALMNERDRYDNEVARIENDLKDDPFNKMLLEQKQKYIELSQQATLAAMNERKAVQDLVKEGMQIELDNLQKLINKYNESLDNAKNLYDYQKNIAKQTKNIAKLEKQATAFSFDNSEEGQAMRQKISVQLEEAREQLEDTEYQHYITEQKKILSDMYSKYEQKLNELSDNIIALFKDAMARHKSNKDEICKTILALGLNVNPYLEDILKSDEPIKNATIHETRVIDKDILAEIHAADDFARNPHERKVYEGGTGKPPVPEKKEEEKKDEKKEENKPDKKDGGEEADFKPEQIFRATSKVYSDALQNLLTQYQKAISKNNTEEVARLKSDLTKILSQITAQANADKDQLTAANKDYFNTYWNLKATGVDSDQTKFGNVDLNKLKSIIWSKSNINKYADQLKSWGVKSEDILGTETSIMAQSGRYQADGKTIAVAFTPILQGADGKATLLSQDAINKYIETLIKKATWNGEPLSFEKVLKLDSKGLEVDGQKINNIIAGVSNVIQGQESYAEKLRKALEYLGPDGEFGKIKAVLEELQRIESLKTLADQLKKLGIEAVDVEKIIKRLKEAGTDPFTAADIKKPTTTSTKTPTKTKTITTSSTPTVDKSVEAKVSNFITYIEKNRGNSKEAQDFWSDDKLKSLYAHLINVGGFASGTKKITKNEIAWTQENKPETIVRKSDHAVLTRLGKGDRVYNAAASENMWKAANDPLTYIKDALSDTPVQAGSSVAGTSIGNITYSVNIPIERVQDYNDFVNQMRADGKFEKMIQSMTIDRITGGSKLAKNKYQWS